MRRLPRRVPPSRGAQGLGSGVRGGGAALRRGCRCGGASADPAPGGVGGARVGTAGKEGAGTRGARTESAMGGSGVAAPPGRRWRGGRLPRQPRIPALPEQMAPGVSAGALLTLFSAGPGSRRLIPRPTEGLRGPGSPSLRGCGDLRGVTVTLPGVAAGSQPWVRRRELGAPARDRRMGCWGGGVLVVAGWGQPCQPRALSHHHPGESGTSRLWEMCPWGAGSPGSATPHSGGPVKG